MSAVLDDPLAQAHAAPARLQFHRFGPVLGATVTGVDLRQPLDAATRAALRAGVVEHGVLFLRDQRPDAQQLLDFAGIFGAPLRHNPYLPAADGHDGIESIETSATRTVSNDAWHADVTWVDPPPRFTVLHAQVLPAGGGGDTVFTNAVAAYASLPPQLAAYLETLTAVNAFDANGFALGSQTSTSARRAEIRANHPPLDVPVIKTHPETGQKYIFVTEQHTRYLKNLPRNFSESLLRLLAGVLESPEFQLRFAWEPHSLAVWDNRVVQHRAIRDYGTTTRVLHRVTIA